MAYLQDLRRFTEKGLNHQSFEIRPKSTEIAPDLFHLKMAEPWATLGVSTREFQPMWTQDPGHLAKASVQETVFDVVVLESRRLLMILSSASRTQALGAESWGRSRNIGSGANLGRQDCTRRHRSLTLERNRMSTASATGASSAIHRHRYGTGLTAAEQGTQIQGAGQTSTFKIHSVQVRRHRGVASPMMVDPHGAVGVQDLLAAGTATPIGKPRVLRCPHTPRLLKERPAQAFTSTQSFASSMNPERQPTLNVVYTSVAVL